MKRVLVTGADGFVGRAVCRALAEHGHTVVAGTRSGAPVPGAAETRPLGDMGRLTDTGNSDNIADNWADKWVETVDAIVHLAARVHVMADRAADPLAAFRQINVDATRRLAEAARRADVRRLIFLSSVKVNGEATGGTPFSEADPPNPQDPYGQSKWEAEMVLRDAGADGALETVILRPPLVYGPGVRANFLSLLKLCDTGLPLPLGGITGNRRSLIYVENLADALCCALDHPAAAGGTYLVSDGPTLSTAALARQIRSALNRPPRLLPVPPSLCRAMLACAGKRAAADRLTGSLVVDTSLIANELGWQPRYSPEEGIAETVAWYRQVEASNS